MPTEFRRSRFKVVGHMIESDERVLHYLRAEPKADGTGAGPAGGDSPVIYTTRLDIIPDDSVIEVVGTWEVVTKPVL